jgi:coproporphyrinogen III oxidase
MMILDDEQAAARHWFESLRDRICAEFVAIEREAGSDADFSYLSWNRDDDPQAKGGGGVRGVMTGQVFEKVGVNVSTVGGDLSGDFAKTIHGAGENPTFFATGISLVAHMANPHVPAVHMNMRFLVTQKRWFGGGADLNPALPIAQDTEEFHATLRAACDAHPGPGDYPRYKK